MNLYEEYLNEIKTREKQGLSAKPIDDGDLAAEIIAHVKDANNKHHDQCVEFLIFNVLPGTTKAADKKAEFLKQVIDGDCRVDKITSPFRSAGCIGRRSYELAKYTISAL